MPNQSKLLKKSSDINDSHINDCHINDSHLHDVHHACTQVEDCNHDFEHIHPNEHNKENVIAERIAQAKEVCGQRGVRFTKLREQVYKLILSADKPIGAYDLLSQMQQQVNQNSQIINEDNQNNDLSKAKSKPKNVAPPTVYRSLDFLRDVGFIHQLTSINAFVPCCHPRDKHLAGFLICIQCERVQECSNSAVNSLVNHTKNSIGFAVTNAVIEMAGICKNCQEK